MSMSHTTKTQSDPNKTFIGMTYSPYATALSGLV